MKVILFVIIVSPNIIYSQNLQKNKPNIQDDFVNYWVANYFTKTTDSNTITGRIKEEDYHIFKIASENFDSVIVSLYAIGLNFSHSYEFILIHRKYKNKTDECNLIDKGSLINNLEYLYDFFQVYDKFSDKTKLTCYERFILDEKNANRFYKK